MSGTLLCKGHYVPNLPGGQRLPGEVQAQVFPDVGKDLVIVVEYIQIICNMGPASGAADRPALLDKPNRKRGSRYLKKHPRYCTRYWHSVAK